MARMAPHDKYQILFLKEKLDALEDMEHGLRKLQAAETLSQAPCP